MPHDIASAEHIASLPETERQAFIEQLDDYKALALRYLWPFWARKAQLAPPRQWRVWALIAGRGFGKTRAAAEWVIEKAETAGLRLALIAETAADARDVIVEGESGILACAPPWNRPVYEPSKRRLTWPNGTIATLYSGEKPDQLRGPQHHYAWADEPAKWRYLDDAWENMELGLRLGDYPQVVAATTPRPLTLIKEWLEDTSGDTVVTRGSTYDNIANLAPAFIRRVVKRYEGTTRGRQELYAEILDDIEGALWTRDMIKKARVRKPPEHLVRIVVGVDPHASTGETGIIVAGVNEDGDGYVLDDLTTGGSPLTWASQVIVAYHKYQADRVIAETNNGGDMVVQTLASVDPSVPVKKVWASRGKAIRADPVVSLYEQGRIHHVGMFAMLEDELCSWVPGEGMPSPNRLDAMVWAVTALDLVRRDDLGVTV